MASHNAAVLAVSLQPANMPLLDALLEKKIRMIDYECITRHGIRNGSRLVAFGRFAGVSL
jgi:alpha-aminoadipic semialdehyde synthase